MPFIQKLTDNNWMKIFKFLGIFFWVSQIKSSHYEKFFEIDGGPEFMYYFSKFEVGSSGSS